MKKKDHADKKKDQPKKTPHQFKDFVPSSLFQNLQPQSQIILPQDKQQSTFNYQSIYSLKPNDPLPDWDYKTPDEVNKDIYDDDPQQQQPTSSKLYDDPDHVHIVNNLPLYFVQIHDNDFIWARPSEYVPNYHIDREIKRLYPKKNYTSMRDDIKKTYTKIKRMQMQTDKNNDEDEEEEEEDIDTYLKNDEITMKQTIYKDFYKHLETEYEYYIVNCDTRIETDEEYIKRKELEEKEKTHNKKGNKKQNKSKNVPIKIEENDKLTYRIVKPSMLNLNEFKSNTLMHNSFYAWYASIFQMIIDMDITDCYTNKSVLYNIYPQKDNAPVYNPQGKYIVKLYHMGKAKKIVIDDRMPCNKDQEFILPQCTNIEELWPALLVKALLKLNMYKTRHPCYYAKEEFMDVSVIHALTGMHVIAMDVNNEIITLFKDEFKVRAITSVVNANGGNANTNSENDTNTVNNNNNNEQQQQPIYQNDKVYYALYHFKPSRFMIIDSEMYSYYDYIERIEFSKQKSGAFINSLNLQENKIVLVKNTNGVVFSRIKQRSGTIRIDKPFSYNSNSNSSSAFINQLSSLNFQPLDKTNAVGDGNNNKDNKKKQLRNKKRFPTLIQAKKLNINLKRKENLISTTNIISNYVYPINDFFTNEDFNMRRLKFMDFSDLERVLNDRKVQFKQLALNEKKQYLIARKELKIKQIEEKNKRLNELKEKGNEYVLLKITDRAVDAPEIEFFKEYNENEINLAKKCLLNNWMFPPVEFFENDFKRREEMKRQQWLLALSMAKDKKDEEESNTQKEVSVKKKKKKILNLTRSRKDETLINANAVNQQVEDTVNNNMGNEIITQQQVVQQQQSQQLQQPQQHKKKKKKYGPFAWNQELYVEYIGGNTDIYKTNNIEPMHSLIPGKWLTTSDMMLNFNKLLIIQNHNKIYHNKILADNNWNYYTTDSFESLAEYNSFILTYDRTSKDEDDPLDKEYSLLIIFEPFNEEMQEHIDCRAIFQPFISFDLINISNGMEIPIQSNILLNKFYSIYTYTHLNRNEIYLIKIVGGTFPMGYVLQVMTENHNIRNLTHDQYLKEYQHYTLTSFHCEHPIIEQDKFYLISRIAVLVNDDDSSNNNNNSNINNEQQSSSHCEDGNDGSVIIPSSLQDEITFKLTLKYNPIYFKQYIRIFIIREDSDIKKEVEPNKPFKMNGSDFIKSQQQQQIQNEEILNSSNSSNNINNSNSNNNMSTQKQNPNISTNAFNNNTTSSNKYYKYYFVIYMKSQYTIKEGAFDIDILSDDKLIKFELIEHIDPFEIHEKYTPNKKGIVFGYYIYPSEKITCSLNISLYHILKEIKTEAQKETTSKAKGKSQSNTVNPITNNVYIETSPLQNKIHCISELYHLTKEPSLDFVKDSLKFSYSNQGELIGKWHFYNTLTLVNLNLNGELLIQDKDPKKKGKKDQSIDTKQLSTTNYPYLLLCYFDITEVNKDIIDDINNNIGYTIRVFASNSIAFIKDTSKEDHEKLMIDEWEAKDEGRSLRAVKSRKKYLLYEKAQRNDVLNTEENKELNEERERRKANQIDHIEEEETTNANANVKGAKGRDNKRKRSLKVKEPVNKKGNVKGKQTDKDKNDKPQEDEYGIHSNLFRCILKNRELSMKNIFQTPLPKCEESKSQYILNYIKYTYRNRSITKTPTARSGNTINDNIILADDNYRNTVKRNILNKYEESELLLKNKHSFMNCTINEMNDNIKQLTRNLSMTRILRKEKSEKLFKARNTIKAELDKRCDIVKKINNVMKDKNKTINDFSQILSIYQDAITILGDSNELVQTYFKYCSAKREEMIKQDIKKYTPKDKNTIIKLLEEINTSKWLISAETLNTLQSLIK